MNCFVQILGFLFSVFIFCEFLVYYIVIFQCEWPTIENNKNDELPIKAMILADTHLLGPYRGHWLDKLRREWQMHRAFQTTMTIFNPELIFILGDLFDEGGMVNHEEFNDYVIRFHQLFHTPSTTKMFSIVGNHDIGFHYRMHPFFTERFEETFNNTGVSLHTIRNVHFVTINSMAMENDQCYFCEMAMEELNNISEILNCYKYPRKCKNKRIKKSLYSKPIIMQHFPTYRHSDISCIKHDSPEIEKYQENWDVLSKESTKLLGDALNPRLAFSGHSHNYCHLKNILNINEYTIASFSWRNKNEPSFLLAIFTTDDYAISVCYMPQESTVICIYTISVLLIICLFMFKVFLDRNNKKHVKNL